MSCEYRHPRTCDFDLNITYQEVVFDRLLLNKQVRTADVVRRSGDVHFSNFSKRKKRLVGYLSSQIFVVC